MKTEQINALLAALGEIRDRLPKPPPPPLATNLARAVSSLQRLGQVTVEVTPATVTRKALQAVLEALDGWIEGAYENHGALDHRAEPVGSECWRQFHPADIRSMVNDAARQLGVAEFPPPGVAGARENTVCQ